MSNNESPKYSEIRIAFGEQYLDETLRPFRCILQQNPGKHVIYVHHFRVKSGKTLRLIKMYCCDTHHTGHIFEYINAKMGNVINNRDPNRSRKLAEYLVRNAPQYNVDGIVEIAEGGPCIFADARKLEFVGCEKHC